MLRTDRLNMFPPNYPVALAALAANTGNVDMVMVAGRIAKRGGELVDIDLDRVRRLAVESRDNLLERVGTGFDEIWSPSAFTPKAV